MKANDSLSMHLDNAFNIKYTHIRNFSCNIINKVENLDQLDKLIQEMKSVQ